MTSLDCAAAISVLNSKAGGLPTYCAAFSPSASLLGVGTGSLVKVYETASLSRTAVPLAEFEHTASVTALAFSGDQEGAAPTMLCVSHRKGTTLWMDARNTEAHEHSILDECVDSKRCIVFNHSCTYVAVAIGTVVCIVSVNTRQQSVRLEGHSSEVTAMAFSIFKPNQLCTASEDRTFKIWDVNARCLIYQSAVISPYPFTSLAFDPSRERFVLGSEDGKLRFYTIKWVDRTNRNLNGYGGKNFGRATVHAEDTLEARAHIREEHCLDVGILLQKRHNILQKSIDGDSQSGGISSSGASYGTHSELNCENDTTAQVVSSLPRWAQDLAAETATAKAASEDIGDGISEREADDGEDEFPKTALSMYFRMNPLDKDQAKDEDGVPAFARDDRLTGEIDECDDIIGNCGGASWKRATSWLVVGTPCALLHINTSSFVVDAMLDLRSLDSNGSNKSKRRSKWDAQNQDSALTFIGNNEGC
eukprot:g2795.t1